MEDEEGGNCFAPLLSGFCYSLCPSTVLLFLLLVLVAVYTLCLFFSLIFTLSNSFRLHSPGLSISDHFISSFLRFDQIKQKVCKRGKEKAMQ